MSAGLEQKFICLFCGYRSNNKLFVCPECDRTKFVSQFADKFICLECNYSSSELFEKCPDCELKSRSKQKRNAKIFSYNSKKKDQQTTPNSQKEPIIPKEQNDESASIEAPEFTFLDDIHENADEDKYSTQKAAGGIIIVVITPILLAIAYNLYPEMFSRKNRFYLFFFLFCYLGVYVYEAVIAHFKFTNRKIRIQATIFYCFCWLTVLIGAFILHRLN